MTGSTFLLIHNIGYISSSILIICLAILIYVKDHKQIANKLMIGGFICVALFSISHLIAVNINNSVLSQEILTFNLSTIFIGVFLTHATLNIIGKAKKRKTIIVILYAVSIALATFFLIFPDTFLLTSVPKMYFPNYYQGGSLYGLMIVWNIAVSVYSIVELALAYHTTDLVLKNRIKYLAFGYVFGYGFGSAAYFLVVNIPVDPIWSSFFIPMFSIPFTYAVLKYELMDIKIIAKQAFLFAITVVGVGGIITLLNFSNQWIESTYPIFPFWIMPLASAFIAVVLGFFVWQKIRETDVLKYEFITVITHKFRTPLTRIKWAAEDTAASVPQEKKKNIDAILESERQLLALTDTLVHLSAADVSNFDYHPSPIDIESLFQDLSNQYGIRAERRGVKLSFSATPGMFIMIDAEKSIFVFQILIDNALNYTPTGGSITVKAYPDPNGKRGTIEVSDTGIGMSPETASRVFKRFYRGANARHADTEGMGIGLFMAKSIAEKQNGKISVKSEGEGKGSTFSIHLPLCKNPT
jgi:signal transduction histidine kinase